ncbi:MAG: hypothetical protein R3C99_05550 [Pirellulaceae bacterium]
MKAAFYRVVPRPPSKLGVVASAAAARAASEREGLAYGIPFW